MIHAEDFEAGAKIELGSWPVTEDEIVEFGRKWDPFPFHTDPEAAARSQFGGLIASGVHLLAILQILQYRAVIGRTAMVAGLGFSELRISAPAYAGTVLTGRMDIDEVRRRADGRAVVRWQGTLRHEGERVLTVGAAAMIRQRRTEEQV